MQGIPNSDNYFFWAIEQAKKGASLEERKNLVDSQQPFDSGEDENGFYLNSIDGYSESSDGSFNETEQCYSSSSLLDLFSRMNEEAHRAKLLKESEKPIDSNRQNTLDVVEDKPNSVVEENHHVDQNVTVAPQSPDSLRVDGLNKSDPLMIHPVEKEVIKQIFALKNPHRPIFSYMVNEQIALNKEINGELDSVEVEPALNELQDKGLEEKSIKPRSKRAEEKQPPASWDDEIFPMEM